MYRISSYQINVVRVQAALAEHVLRCGSPNFGGTEGANTGEGGFLAHELPHDLWRRA